MYISYEFYQQYGGTATEDEFEALEAKAEAIISYLTYHNGDIFAEEDNRVKLAVCAAVDTIQYQSEMSNAAGIKSENNDGYSVSFVQENRDGQTAEVFLQQKVRDSIVVYLEPTGWLGLCMRGGFGFVRPSAHHSP